jgi:hypothetical protein
MKKQPIQFGRRKYGIGARLIASMPLLPQGEKAPVNIELNHAVDRVGLPHLLRGRARGGLVVQPCRNPDFRPPLRRADVFLDEDAREAAGGLRIGVDFERDFQRFSGWPSKCPVRKAHLGNVLFEQGHGKGRVPYLAAIVDLVDQGPIERQVADAGNSAGAALGAHGQRQ